MARLRVSQTARIVRPALGGPLYGIGPAPACFVCALTLACAATLVWGIPLEAKPATRAPVTLASVRRTNRPS